MNVACAIMIDFSGKKADDAFVIPLQKIHRLRRTLPPPPSSHHLKWKFNTIPIAFLQSQKIATHINFTFILKLALDPSALPAEPIW